MTVRSVDEPGSLGRGAPHALRQAGFSRVVPGGTWALYMAQVHHDLVDASGEGPEMGWKGPLHYAKRELARSCLLALPLAATCIGRSSASKHAAGVNLGVILRRNTGIVAAVVLDVLGTLPTADLRHGGSPVVPVGFLPGVLPDHV
eukprot:CAMPEP_0204293302 /NCGR_PEP_ID=MMETSP0468-20130131/65953_1 /ASSEMBLY_ACC=CAM_ASM_000383 /TAXON_ID=2969 /ORGANISM="Oxyrrhis marina" /LENGTH=145 /DNA_ID=CAMNT_0051271765 /DNA_START=634 /DNA_END=1069 /DNA_ORIENTATION=-